MAIANITPVTGSVINPGDSFTFTVDDTYTSMVIQAVTATSTEQVYNSGSGGAQSGYTVSVSSPGGTDTFTVARDAGWDLSPQQIYVTEDETGSSAQTGISYVLANTSIFPQGVQPYNSTEGIPADSFLALSDSPSSYSGQAGKGVTVNSTEDGVEFQAGGGGGGAITVEDEGTPLTSAVTQFNFVGAGVTATEPSPDEITVTVPGGGFVNAPDAALFTERADHVNTPATGKGELWLGSGTAPPTLIYTDEAGADKTIAAGVTSGNAAQFLAVNSGGTDFEFVKQYHYVYIPITFAGAATGTYYGHPANAFWTYTGNNIARGTTQGSPTTPNYMTSPSMAFAGKVVQVTGFYNHLVSTYGGDVELWKTAYTDDSATATMTEMGPGGGFFNIPTTGHTSGRNYDWSTAISSNNTFAAGDDLEILYWQDTVGVIRGSITLTCEVT